MHLASLLTRLLAPDYWTGRLVGRLHALLKLGAYLLRHPSRAAWRMSGLILKIKPAYTMVHTGGLMLLYELAADLNRRGVAGDVVECGVWNGGSAALMGVAMARTPPLVPRTFWLFDSFQGLPEPTAEDGRKVRSLFFKGWCAGSAARVREAFQQLGLPLDPVRIVPGWFDQTLAQTPVGEIALLHVDADWYESVKIVLETYYDKVAPGGYVIFDDYGFFQGCDRAVDEFMARRGLDPALLARSRPAGAYFQKPR